MDEEIIYAGMLVMLAAMFLIFLGFMIHSSDTKMETCLTHNGSWIKSDCVMTTK